MGDVHALAGALAGRPTFHASRGKSSEHGARMPQAGTSEAWGAVPMVWLRFGPVEIMLMPTPM